ncbi:MAG: RND family transporter [Deltaproteobacteria bacterium]|nr:RND family transporter [Deltaproteobacteria bacterium]
MDYFCVVSCACDTVLRIMRKVADFIVRFRWLMIVSFIAATALSAYRLPNAEIDPEIKSMLPADMVERLDLNRIEDLFGGTEMVMLVISAEDVLATDTLKRLRKISRRMGRLKQVDRVLSLFTLKDIRSQDDTLVVDPAIKRIPTNDESRERLRAELKTNEVVYGNVVSKDFRATAVIGMLNAKAKDDETMAGLKQLIADVPGPEQVEITGMPHLRHHLAHTIPKEFGMLMSVGLALMLLFLFACFRQIRGMLLPFVVVVMSIAFGMGLIPLLGWNIQMITILVPIILIAVANDYGIHVLARFQEENQPGDQRSSKELARAVVRHLVYPVLVTGLTTIAGLLCLLSHIIIPARQVGILAASAVAFALVGSLVFIPAWLAVLKKPKPVVGVTNRGGRIRPLERMLHAVASLVAHRPRGLLVSAVVIAAVTASGMYFLVVDTDPMAEHPYDSPIRRVARLVDKSFGGSAALSMVAHGDIKDPAVLKRIDAVEKRLAALPDVGQTSSVAKLVRQMNRVLDDESPEPNKIPDTRQAVAQYFLLYSMAGDPEDFDRVVDFNYENSLITARLNTLSSNAINRVMEFARAEKAAAPEGFFPVVGGFIGILGRMSEAIVNGQIASLLLSLVLVSLLVMMLFRSFVAGILAVIPIGMALALLFGLMGYTGIPLNITTAMLSSIMIGVGIDYTIHFLWRYREERRKGKQPPEAVRVTLTTTGRGIVFNALSVIIGFAALFLSYFLALQWFGFLVVVTIGACLVGALGLLPALCLVLRPRFLEPRN